MVFLKYIPLSKNLHLICILDPDGTLIFHAESVTKTVNCPLIPVLPLFYSNNNRLYDNRMKSNNSRSPVRLHMTVRPNSVQ